MIPEGGMLDFRGKTVGSLSPVYWSGRWRAGIKKKEAANVGL